MYLLIFGFLVSGVFEVDSSIAPIHFDSISECQVASVSENIINSYAEHVLACVKVEN